MKGVFVEKAPVLPSKSVNGTNGTHPSLASGDVDRIHDVRGELEKL
jgi:hypothetical protein